MKAKFHLVSILCVLTWFSIQGQNYSREFGKISKEELELKEYPADKDAEAVVLFDMAKTFFDQKDGEFEVVFERTTRVKVLSEAGIRWAEVEIPFYREGSIYEKVYDIEAYTYNTENGQINRTPLNIATAFDEKIDNNWNVKKFAIPNVRSGSIIEYRYTIDSPYKFNLRDWQFQWKIPVVYSEYVVRMIPFYEYTFLLQGANKFDEQVSTVDKQLTRHFSTIAYNDVVSKFVMKNVPAFYGEEFITSINDYIIKLDFQLSKIIYPNKYSINILTTWEEMNKDLLKHKDFGKYLQQSEKLASELLNMEDLKQKSNKEKFDAILNYVKANYNWDRSTSKYASKTVKEFVKLKHGNCADINLLTIGLLNASGIDAKPVLISTRNHGKIQYDYPYLHFFNYVIIYAQIDGENILSDATEVLGLNNRIPARCINDKGIIVQSGRVDWVGLECKVPSEIRTEMKIEITNEARVKSEMTTSATEYDALYYRRNYSDKPEHLKKKLETAHVDIIEGSIAVEHQFDREQPFILRYTQVEKLEDLADKIYLPPFLNATIGDNPLKQKERTYPVDMTYPKKRVYNSTIRIPDGYVAEYLPGDQRMSNQLFELSYTVSADEQRITIAFEYAFKKSVYTVSEYEYVKTFYNEIVKKGNERVVLAKRF